jgi:HK97 family phage major capsid protein
MSFPALKEAREKYDAKAKSLSDIFSEAGDTVDLTKVQSVPGTIKGNTRLIAAHVRALNDECSELLDEVKDLEATEAAVHKHRSAPGDRHGESGDENRDRSGQGDSEDAVKTLGELFVKSVAFTGKTRGSASGPPAELDVELKTLLSTGAGWSPEVMRTGKLVDFATRPIQVTDIIPQTTTTQSAIQYMEETTFTNAAAEVAESTQATPAPYPEAALVLTERTSLVRKVAVFLPMTDEQLEDVPQARGYVQNRLPFMLRQRLDGQVLSGNGTPPNLTGILNVAGVQTQAKGADPVPDAVYKAMVKVRVTGRALPGAAIFHPTDWQGIRLLRTADGIYIWGNPSDAGPERIWGLPAVQSDAITLGTALVGDFQNFSELATRRGIDVQISNSHADYFTNGKQAVRADMRVALVVYRPTAFCSVTGL